MIILASTADVIKVITGSNLAADVHATWIDLLSSTPTPGRTNTAISTAATTNIVAAPASSTYRNVKTISIRNKDATSSNAITVQHFDGTTTVDLYKVTLQAGYLLMYNEIAGWVVYDTSGAQALAAATGRLVKTSLISGATTTFTTGPATTAILIQGVGAGAGGAGCTSVASSASAGGGGGAGSYARKLFTVTPNTTYALTCGAAGLGASGALGANGGSSTFVVGATTVTAPGGTGAPVATAATTLTAYAGGAGGTVSTNGDVNAGGQPGEHGVVLIVATPVMASGEGGSGPFGSGGVGITAGGNGNAATGFGAGGGGAATGASAVRTGGNGTGGCWVVDEFS